MGQQNRCAIHRGEPVLERGSGVPVVPTERGAPNRLDNSTPTPAVGESETEWETSAKKQRIAVSGSLLVRKHRPFGIIFLALAFLVVGVVTGVVVGWLVAWGGELLSTEAAVNSTALGRMVYKLVMTYLSALAEGRAEIAHDLPLGVLGYGSICAAYLLGAYGLLRMSEWGRYIATILTACVIGHAVYLIFTEYEFWHVFAAIFNAGILCYLFAARVKGAFAAFRVN